MAASIDLAPPDIAGYEQARQYLSGELVSWAQHSGRQLHPHTGEEFLHYKWGYLDDNLVSWRCADLDRILLELFPAKMLLAPDEADEMLDESRTFLTFLSETGHLDPAGDTLAALVRHLNRMGPEMRRRLGDARLYSWGKRMWRAMAKEGIMPGDPTAVQAWQRRFGSLSMAEKEALLGGPLRNLPAWAGPGRFTSAVAADIGL